MRFQPSKNPPEEKERTCDYCGKKLVGRQMRFCCRQHKKNHHENMKREEARKPRPCKTCGKIFKPAYQKESTCSLICRKARLQTQKNKHAERVRLAISATAEKMRIMAEKKERIKRENRPKEEKVKKIVKHHPAIQRIIDMIKSKRQSCARFEETVGSVDYVGLMQIKHLEDKLKVMGVKYAV